MPITQTGWSRGLANVLHGELYTWFATRRWWVQILIWAACGLAILQTGLE